jgi:pectate lyase
MDGEGSQYLAGGTTGGAGGTIVTVTTPTDLTYYAGQTNPYIIQVKGQIVYSSLGDITIKSNKTIIGIGNDAAIVAHGLDMSAVKNIIIKNLTIKDNYIMGDYDGKRSDNDKDAIALRNTHHVWIDHCHLHRAGDGLLDMSYASGYVTISYTIFSHHNKATYGDGIKSSPFTPGRYTYDHCWFNNTCQRNAASTNAYIHAYNCYHLGVRSYCMNPRNDATYGIPSYMLLENMYFKQSNYPYKEEGGFIQANGNILDECSNILSVSGTTYTPPYSYQLDNTADVPSLILAEAGPGGFLNMAASPAIFINFRPSSYGLVRGYNDDTGSTYGDRGSGYSYGWDATNTSNAFWRQTISWKDDTSLVPVDADYRRNSIIATGNGARYWEIGLPNGMYYIHLMCGEPGDPRNYYPANNVLRNNTMNIEGTIVTDPDPDANSDYDEYYVIVNVTDGNLTISQAPDGNDSALCFVDIFPAKNPENPDGNAVNGLYYRYYEGSWSFVPDFDSLTPVKRGTAANFDINDINNLPSGSNFGLVFEGYIDVPSDGNYVFYTTSDEGSKLYIGSIEVVDNDGIHPMQEASGEILLKAGKHFIKAVYFEKTGSEGLEVRWEGPGIAKELIPDNRLYRIRKYGDLTDDGIVDMTDLFYFTEYWWLKRGCDETAGLDLDGNCIINFYEFSVLARSWSQTGP